jgi:hypothetical protein
VDDAWDAVTNGDPAGWLDCTLGTPQPSTFWSKRAWELRGPLSQRYHYVFDRLLWLSFALGGFEALRLPVPLSVIRLHNRCKTISESEDFLREFPRAFQEFSDAFPRSELPAIAKRIHAYASRCYTSQAVKSLDQHKYLACARLMLKAFLASPRLMLRHTLGDARRRLTRLPPAIRR